MRPERIVVKVGSSLLAPGDGGLDAGFLAGLVGQVAELVREGRQVLIVSSGAIAAGLEALGMKTRPKEMPNLQAAAAVGQTRLIGAYADAFAAHGMRVGQVLVTRHDTAHRTQYLHARDTLDRLMGLGVVPVVNENDTTAVEEIRFGDNDTLAAVVATMVRADLVVMLTDIDGLYSADPRRSRDADLLARVEELTAELVAGAGGAGSSVGTGGMLTKVEAARFLMKAAIDMVLCDGRMPGVVLAAARGEQVGTRFSGREGQMRSRKLWIALAGSPVGRILLDEGAVQAVRERGKSLLPAGVVGVEGEFAPGDTVTLLGSDGCEVARGITAISSRDLAKVMGLRTAEIAGVLPEFPGGEVVHRDHLVVV